MPKTIAPLQPKDKPSYTDKKIASRTMTSEELDECRRLAARFAGMKNRAKWARENNVPGGDSMIYQNIDERKPISTEGAIAYARGFGCFLDEISPRIAAEIDKAASLLRPGNPNRTSQIDPLHGLSEAAIRAAKYISKLPPNSQEKILHYLEFSSMLRSDEETEVMQFQRKDAQ